MIIIEPLIFDYTAVWPQDTRNGIACQTPYVSVLIVSFAFLDFGLAVRSGLAIGCAAFALLYQLSKITKRLEAGLDKNGFQP